jgi:excisionase family DNA binding protein
VDLTPQDLWSLRNIIIRAVNESHEVLAEAAWRAKSERRDPPAPQQPAAAPAPPPAPEREDGPRLAYSLKEAARTLGLSRSTLYKLIAQGDLRALHIGSRRLIEVADIEALLSRARSAR